MIRLVAAGWLLACVGAPIAVLLAVAFAVPADTVPPFAFGEPAQSWPSLFADGFFLASLGRSLLLAAVTACLCLALAFPMALGVLRCPPGSRPLLLGLLVLPFGIGFALRMAAWIGLLRDSGVVNALLLASGLIGEPLRLLHAWPGLLLGMVHSYLIFALLPLYAALAARDLALEEAAADLGASRMVAFATVTLPGAAAAAGAAFLLVFIPAAGEFVVPELLGPPEALLAGRAIWQEFFATRDWPVAAAASVALLAVLAPPILLWQSLGRRR
jgi:putrescine transport system permease protein